VNCCEGEESHGPATSLTTRRAWNPYRADDGKIVVQLPDAAGSDTGFGAGAPVIGTVVATRSCTTASQPVARADRNS